MHILEYINRFKPCEHVVPIGNEVGRLTKRESNGIDNFIG